MGNFLDSHTFTIYEMISIMRNLVGDIVTLTLLLMVLKKLILMPLNLKHLWARCMVR